MSTQNDPQALPTARHRARRRWRLAGLLVLGAIWGLFIAASFFSVDVRALSPVGLLVVVATLAIVVVRAIKVLARLRARPAALATLLSLLLVAAAPPPPTDLLPWRTLFWDNVTLLGNPHAWRATADVNLNRGLPGIAPFYFRTVVPHVPVALVGVPDAALGVARVTGLVSGHHRYDLAQAPPILDTLPAGGLWPNHIVIVQDAVAGPARDTALLASSLYGSCTAGCYTRLQLDIDPQYAAKLAIDGLVLATTVLSVPRQVSGSVSVLDTVGDLLLSPEWNVQVARQSYGTTYMAGSEFNWYSNTVQRYAGSILDSHWTLQESQHLVVTQHYGAGSAPIFDPDLLANPDLYVPQFDWTAIDAPAVRVPGVLKLPDFELTINLTSLQDLIWRPGVHGPDLSVPTVVVPEVGIPTVTIPDIEIPTVTIPDIELPDIVIPTPFVPNFTLP